MTNTLSFEDESLEHSVRRRAEYDDSSPGDLILSVPRRSGGIISLPLLTRARSNLEQETLQDNTLLRIKPLAEIASNLPVKAGGLTFHTGRGVALLRPGYLYVFRGEVLWRELEIDSNGLMSDIDLQRVRQSQAGPEQASGAVRASEGKWLSDILVPVLLQGRTVINEIRVAYSEVQWDWRYVCRLEEDARARLIRTSGIEHAWPAATVEGLTFETGYPASNIESVDGLRSRDLGVELMLENPADFLPEFESPADDELCMRLRHRLERIANANGQEPVGMDLSGEASVDRLEDLRSQKGLVCVSIPDPLFKLRHSLTQLHLALHYLDAVDTSIQQQPMVHSAMLIRQAVFDPLTLGGNTNLQKYADAIDKQKLDEVLDTKEKEHAVAVIDRHVERLQELMKKPVLAAVLDDYRECTDVAICEGYLLIADKLNLLQQIPGVLRANGIAREYDLFKSLKQWLFKDDFLAAWAPQPPDTTGQNGSETSDSAAELLRQLTQDQTDATEEMLGRLNLQSLAYLEKQLYDREVGTTSIAKNTSDAGKAGSLIARALEEWSTAVLKVGERLMEEGMVSQVEIQRVMQAAASNFTLADPALAGIKIVNRGGVEASGTILGVRGEGLTRGLTEFDRTEGILTRKNDYLYADLIDDSGEIMGSTSPSRAADELEAVIKKSAGQAAVFYAPAGHLEAQKLSLVRVDLAKKVSDIVEGPAVSRGLVALALFNMSVELISIKNARDSLTNEKLAHALAGAFGGLSEITAASLKLSIALNPNALPGTGSRTFRLAVRPLFDLKNWFYIGNRLQEVGAPTLVRTVGLASFTAGVIGVAVSGWDLRDSLAKNDYDSANGHAVALAGGMIFVLSPLMHSLVAIPGWGWAILGMSMVVGGSIYAGRAADDSFEQLLKHGPWGNYARQNEKPVSDQAYYNQLLTLLSPISVTAKKYEDSDQDPALSHHLFPPVSDDYVITIQSPLVSQLTTVITKQPGLPKTSFNLVVQELAYVSSTSGVSGTAGSVQSHHLRNTSQLRKVVARQSLPEQSAVRFLVKRELHDEVFQGFGYRESVWTTVRVGFQAVIETGFGPAVFPSPVLERYEPFDMTRHSIPPAKSRGGFNPHAQPESPYWFFTEVTT